MKRFTYYICALLLVALASPVYGVKSFVGFTANNELGNQIANGLIQDLNNITLSETSTGKYSLVIINVGEESSFSMGGVTFAFSPIETGQTAYKTYNNYIQPNGNDREIRIPTFAGENVKIVLEDFCDDILVDGVSMSLTAGDNELTATGTSIVLRTQNGKKPKISSIVSLEPDGADNPEPLTVANALNFVNEMPSGTITVGYFAITGYVSSMAGNPTDFSDKGYQSFWIADNASSTASSNADGAFYVYRGVATEEIKAGDKVRVTTRITNSSGTILSEPQCSVVIIAHSDPNPDPDPDHTGMGQIEVKSNNCEYGTAVGGGVFIGGSQVTIVAVPATEDCVFDQWEDGVTDNPRIVTVPNPWSSGSEPGTWIYNPHTHKTYVAVFHCNSTGEMFDPLDDDDNPSNPNNPNDPNSPYNPEYRPESEQDFPCRRYIWMHSWVNASCSYNDNDVPVTNPPQWDISHAHKL